MILETEDCRSPTSEKKKSAFGKVSQGTNNLNVYIHVCKWMAR